MVRKISVGHYAKTFTPILQVLCYINGVNRDSHDVQLFSYSCFVIQNKIYGYVSRTEMINIVMAIVEGIN